MATDSCQITIEQSASDPRRFSVASKIWRGVAILVVGATLPTYLAFGARLSWVLELATHFRVHYAMALGLLCFALLALRRWRLLAWVGTAVAVNVALIAPLYFGPSVPKEVGPTMRIMTANLLAGNRNKQEVLALIQKESPDLIVFQEVTLGWARALSVLKDEYPYSFFEPRSDNFGIVLMSRLPTQAMRTTDFGMSHVPSIEATVFLQGTPIHFIGTHTLPPMRARNARIRNNHLALLADKSAATSGARVLMGDLNCTPWSPYFHDLLRHANLHNSQRGFGVQPTWRSQLPIDHVLHSDEIVILDRRVGPKMGSDHQPVIVDLVIKR